MATPKKERIKTGAEHNRLTPQRVLDSARLQIGWPDLAYLPKDPDDAKLALNLFRDGWTSRLSDEWTKLDLMELARYAALMVQLINAQKELEALPVGSKAHTVVLKTVVALTNPTHVIARKLVLYKPAVSTQSQAQQAKREQDMRKQLEGEVVPMPKRPSLLA